MSETSAAFSVEDVSKPFFKVLFGEGALHDWEDSSERVDENDSWEAGVKGKLVLNVLVVACLGPEEADGFVPEVIDDSSDDFEVDLSFFVWAVEDVGQDGDNAKGNIEGDAVGVPLVFIGEFLDQKAFVLLYFLEGPLFKAVGSPGSFVRVVNSLVFGTYLYHQVPAGMRTMWGYPLSP